MRSKAAACAVVAAAVAGLGVIARPGAPGPERAGDRIVVVPGAVATGVPEFRREVPPAPPELAAAAWVPDAPADAQEDVGVWATPAEFDQPEPPS